MLLSVVIPVHNGEKYLKTRVNSLIEAGGNRKTLLNWRFIRN